MMISFFSRAARIKKQTENRLSEHHTKQTDFFILLTIASAIATLGLILNNASIVIGAMVVAPLITPVFGLSLSLIVLNIQRFGKSFLMLLLGTILAIIITMVIAWLIQLIEGREIQMNAEIISRTKPNLLFFLTALFSGMAGAYSYTKPHITASIAGIAISVAVIPPLAVAGIAIVIGNSTIFFSSFLLYLLNLTGIAFGSIIMFISLGFGGEN